MTILGGFDIGGTKCAVSLGKASVDGSIALLAKEQFPTPPDPNKAIDMMIERLHLLQAQHKVKVEAAGVSCGGPLDSARGLILSPPNLPHWDGIDVVSPIRNFFKVPTGVQNDANACALAEWMWGAGRGVSNMVFLTFGTGMGAGFILNGRLYSGTNDMAGEVGHMRLEHEGPVGYGKAGSFEGFCSGGGIARLAADHARESLANGLSPDYCKTESDLGDITALKVGQAALQGDSTALKVFRIVGYQLGRGLAVLIDFLNPELIVIGSIYGRQRNLLEEIALDTVRQEACPLSAAVCRIVPAGLGEHVGDYAGLSVANNVS